MSDPFFLVAATVLGAMIGSFLNAQIYRLPRRMDGQTFGRRSACPHCGAAIPAWFNVPILGWLWLRGRAKCCGKPIHWRYPLVEALTAFLFFMLAYAPPSGHALTHIGMETVAWFAFVLHAFFVANLITNTFIDFDYRILPDVLTKPLMVVGVIGAFLVPGLAGLLPGRMPLVASSVLASLLGLGVGFFLTWGVRRLAYAAFQREAMGFGDVKLMGGIGAFLGWQGALLTFFIGCLAGAFFGVVHRLITKDAYIAFGPFLVLGALVTLFYRAPLIEFLTVTWPEWQREQLQSPLALAGVAVVSLFFLIVLIRRGRNT